MLHSYVGVSLYLASAVALGAVSLARAIAACAAHLGPAVSEDAGAAAVGADYLALAVACSACTQLLHENLGADIILANRNEAVATVTAVGCGLHRHRVATPLTGNEIGGSKRGIGAVSADDESLTLGGAAKLKALYRGRDEGDIGALRQLDAGHIVAALETDGSRATAIAGVGGHGYLEHVAVLLRLRPLR